MIESNFFFFTFLCLVLFLRQSLVLRAAPFPLRFRRFREQFECQLLGMYLSFVFSFWWLGGCLVFVGDAFVLLVCVFFTPTLTCSFFFYTYVENSVHFGASLVYSLSSGWLGVVCLFVNALWGLSFSTPPSPLSISCSILSSFLVQCSCLPFRHLTGYLVLLMLFSPPLLVIIFVWSFVNVILQFAVLMLPDG